MTQSNNPLHGITLEAIVTQLVEHYGWEELGARIKIRCFTEDPSIKSSLRFLRKTDWAREKVEYLYLKTNKLPLPAAKSSNAPAKKPAKPAQKPAKANAAASTTDSQINSHIWGKRD
ncbi:VF530 family protein [Shewanella seohaensis]|uniref:VF530 family protein n=1 Tax=Shewanella seohaensis TaxID=755175 RepID=UPI002010BFB0|nr:VF530 family protein [Shewanella seohaensis]MCL1121616.1 VF530 family protein [Shewanella seohaensis]UXM83791.1 VF530 family protein [Shewanella seohaensis]